MILKSLIEAGEFMIYKEEKVSEVVFGTQDDIESWMDIVCYSVHILTISQLRKV